jgi:hypothetical protein
MTRFNLVFSELQQFIKAFRIVCFEGRTERYWMIIAHEDKLVVVEPKVSTPGLNTLILKNLNETDEEIVSGIATRRGMEVIECESIKSEEEKKLISSTS